MRPSLRAEMMIGFFLSWYRTLRESRRASEIGLESCSNLSSRKRKVKSVVAISNELEQVCSLAYFMVSREAEVLRISSFLFDENQVNHVKLPEKAGDGSRKE